MPEVPRWLVTNTTPLIALTAATGNLDVLKFLYRRVLVPLEVAQEVQAGGRNAFGVDVFAQATWLDIQTREVVLQPFLAGLSHQKQDGDPPSKPIAVHDCSIDGIRGRDG